MVHGLARHCLSSARCGNRRSPHTHLTGQQCTMGHEGLAMLPHAVLEKMAGAALTALEQ
jgi:hypothetical protein